VRSVLTTSIRSAIAPSGIDPLKFTGQSFSASPRHNDDIDKSTRLRSNESECVVDFGEVESTVLQEGQVDDARRNHGDHLVDLCRTKPE
jgi:hypothetical protein